MTDFNKNINPYTAKDFERYYAGQMTASEMHQLEKSALDDPFLQDALDGYELTRQGVADVAALKQQVDQRIQKGRVIPFGRKERTTQLLKVAAMLLLTAGMGWLIYNVAFDNESKNIAVTEKPSINVPAAAGRSADTSTAPIEMKATDDVNNSTATAASPGVRNKESVQDQNNVSQKESGNATAPSVSSPSPGRQVQTDILIQHEAAPPEVALQRSDSSPVVGYGTARKEQPGKESYSVSKRAKTNELEEAVAGQTSASSGYPRHSYSFEEAFPKNGDTDYQLYVTQNLQVPLNENNQAVHGEVQLSFDVNSRGKPVNIQVEKSLCKSCDAEAVRILKEGPPWIQKSKNKKGKFSILF